VKSLKSFNNLEEYLSKTRHMCLSEYYTQIYKLSFINRYTNIIRVRNEDVAQHSFFVAAIVLKLYDKYIFDLGKALQAAISHDITEADLSDITHEVKFKHKNLAKEIQLAEEKEIQKYPKAVIEGVQIFNSNLVEGLVVNYADVLQVNQYVLNEISLGNKNISKIRIETERRINELKKELKQYERSCNENS
jgi:5'-deoxynucleotidase YfbR-like HD superfamily hydrolase